MNKAGEWLNAVMDAVGAPRPVPTELPKVYKTAPVATLGDCKLFKAQAELRAVPSVYRDAAGGIKMSEATALDVLYRLIEYRNLTTPVGEPYDAETVALAAALGVELEGV